MRIGYACLTEGIPNTKMRSCIMKNASPEKLYELIEHNLYSLKNILLFNAENDIRLFRISSDLIPFGSSPVNTLKWWADFSDQFNELSAIIEKTGIRVSMHPGQYTVLNSPHPDVAARAIQDLIYHTRLLDCLNAGQNSKIILHLGGVYGDKDSALKRFAKAYMNLSHEIKSRIAIENDDKSYNINEVLNVGLKLKIPVVYDNLHSELNPFGDFTHNYWIDKCKSTWHIIDGAQKIHYSQQAKGKSPGSHSRTIALKEFIRFSENIYDDSIDIMLEVKDKNISAVKCLNTIKKEMRAFNSDWQRYKYKVLELSHEQYNKIKSMLDSNNFNIIECYTEIEVAFMQTPSILSQKLAAITIWSDCFINAEKKDKENFERLFGLFSEGKVSYSSIRSFLWKMALKYNSPQLQSSFYFHLYGNQAK